MQKRWCEDRVLLFDRSLKTVSQENKKIEIAALMARTRPQNGFLNTAQPSFPANPPQMIPKFINQQTRKERRLQVVKTSSSRLPIIPLVTPQMANDEEMPEEVLAFDSQDPKCVAFVTRIVEEVMAKMGVTGVAVTQKPKGGPSKRAPSRRTLNRRLQQSMMTREHDVWWKVRYRTRDSR